MLFVNHHSIWSSILFEDSSILKQCKDKLTFYEKKRGSENSGWKPTWEPLRFYREDSPYMLSVPTAMVYKLDEINFESRVEDDTLDDFPDEKINSVYEYMTSLDPRFEVREHQVIATKKCMKLKRGIVNMATGCFTGDTLVKTTAGNIKFEDLINNFNDKKVYSSDGKEYNIKDVFISKYTDKLIELEFENLVIRCTPEHRFLLKDGTYKEAQYLTEGDEIAELPESK